jgi:hypothetical protein
MNSRLGVIISFVWSFCDRVWQMSDSILRVNRIVLGDAIAWRLPDLGESGYGQRLVVLRNKSRHKKSRSGGMSGVG